jgi:hypothetical protein
MTMGSLQQQAVAATMAPAGTDRSIDRRTKGLGFTIERSMISSGCRSLWS